jgi:hypothetical protein
VPIALAWHKRRRHRGKRHATRKSLNTRQEKRKSREFSEEIRREMRE